MPLFVLGQFFFFIFCKINDLSHTISYVLLVFFTLMNVVAYNNIQNNINLLLYTNNFCMCV